ncbi:hypothetical protein [Halobacterium litoreum]|uniref:DUF7979 domain-containing protein n=1 Tax=Halobacterium litoreum TaxID=2039234 RepID=A0ABD5NGH0_9EURY|nr:hypothetical protein [Halobacterium litoreum]UHH12754.1 hypothetical protein LT972_11355 [Halobacterium litoreum]
MTVDRRALAVLLAVAGLAAFYVGGTAAFEAAQPEYEHAVSAASPAEVERAESAATETDERVVFAFADLSADARDVFLEALRADGTAVVTDRAATPPEFEYGDTGSYGEGRYLVRYDGEAYVVSATGEQAAAWLGGVPAFAATLLVGGSALLAAVLRYDGALPIRSVTTFVASAVAVGLLAAGVLSNPLFAVTVFFTVAVVAWAGLERAGWGTADAARD